MWALDIIEPYLGILGSVHGSVRCGRHVCLTHDSIIVLGSYIVS